MQRFVTIGEIVKQLNLETVYLPDDALERQVVSPHLNRGGMLLMGFGSLHNPDIIHVFGKREYEYCQQFDSTEKERILDKFFSQKFPLLVLAHGIPPSDFLARIAKKHNIPIFRTQMHPADFTFNYITFMQKKLAPRHTINATLMEVHGEGILITGESGIGKTETSLVLLERGHRWISDDTVDIYKSANGSLVGEPSDLTRHFAEIRGIGIINVKTLFGEKSVLDYKTIDMIVHLVHWNNEKEYDRLGIENKEEILFDVAIPSIVIPVSQGRNIASTIEIAAINNRYKKHGNNSAIDLEAKLKEKMSKQ